jgi:hypothetical protein
MCNPADNGRMRVWTSLVVAAALTHPLKAAVQITLDPRSINEAIAIGQSRGERQRAGFHAPYRLVVNKAPVDYIDVVTPFRHVVLAAEGRAQIGDRSFSQRRALELLAAAPPGVDIHVELTFHPQHTFVGVPDYAVALAEPSGAVTSPRTVERIPRHDPRVEGTPLLLPIPGGAQFPGRGQPMLGGTIIARFDVQGLKPAGRYEVVIADSGKELARAGADFARLR